MNCFGVQYINKSWPIKSPKKTLRIAINMKNEFINHNCSAGLQPADNFSRDGKMVQTDCNLLLYLTNKHDFLKFQLG